MSTINYDLKKIKAFIFDIDGVLSNQTITLSPEGEPMRTINIRDGYAIHHAVKCGYDICIITGGNSEAVRIRYAALGVKYIYMKSSIKLIDFDDFISKTGHRLEELVYVGDDVPDIQVLNRVGLSVAPVDASPDVKKVANYISHIKGGEGVARDIIEQVLKVQGEWLNGEAFGW